MNLAMIVLILGWVLMLEGALMLLPAVTGLIYGETMHAGIYLCVGAVSAAAGWLMKRRKPKSSTFYAREGFAAVALSWIILSLVGALPFVISGDIPFYIDALFEVISGFTTTGSSILPEVERLSHANLLWRSFSHWIGGMGVLVFVLAILPMGGGYTMNLMRAESPGPTVGKLVPRIQKTAATLYLIYFALTMVMIVILLAAGMPVFDTICTAFGTAGTGGYGIHSDSFAGYAPHLQNIVTVFMMLFGVNFSFYYYLLMRRLRDAFGMEEVKWYVLIYLGAVLLITGNLLLTVKGNTAFGYFQEAAFQVSSIMTTTGFSSVDFDLSPSFSKVLLSALVSWLKLDCPLTPTCFSLWVTLSKSVPKEVSS